MITICRISVPAALLFLSSLVCFASAYGLAERISFPVFLPFSEGSQEIEVRRLPFATRYSHPEIVGAVLSSAYPAPHNDSADLPRDINVISMCGIRIETSAAKDAGKGDRVKVALTVDLRNYARPEYLPFEDSEIMKAVANSIGRSLKDNRCSRSELHIKAGDDKEKLKAELDAILRAGKAEGERDER